MSEVILKNKETGKLESIDSDDLSALRAALAEKEKENIENSLKWQNRLFVWKKAKERAEAELAEAQEGIKEIDNCLRGNVCDPDPLQPLWHIGLMTVTTYGLVRGIIRERDKLKAELAEYKILISGHKLRKQQDRELAALRKRMKGIKEVYEKRKLRPDWVNFSDFGEAWQAIKEAVEDK